MEPLIRVEHLRVGYNAADVLNDISFELPAGRLVAVVGDNGAGKTTLFRTLFGELPKRTGSVNLCGLDPFDPRQRLRLWSVARWVPDAPLLYEYLTVREQLEFVAQTYGVPRDVQADYVQREAMKLGLATVLDSRIKQLSSGTIRKVHVALGFFSGVSGPRLLVLDEPMILLDPQSRQVLGDALRRYANPDGKGSDRTVLISSHNLSELSALTDYVIMLEQGRIVRAGPIEDLVGAQQSDLRYAITLFEGCPRELAKVLQERLKLPCEPHGERSVRVEFPDHHKVQELLRFLAGEGTGFRVREIKEEHSALERLYFRSEGESPFR